MAAPPRVVPTAPPPPRRRRAAGRSLRQEPHRGGAILALGIIGLVVCQICSIIAWVMANTDLPKMRDGRMDPEGEGLTSAGKILGIIGVVMIIASIGIVILILVLGAGTAAYSTSGG